MRTFLTGALLLLLVATSCDTTKSKGFNPVTGKVGEILVVTDNSIWESDLKMCLDTNLTQWIMPYFPDVATFQLIHKTPTRFKEGVKRYRNILFLNIDPNFNGNTGKIVKRKDVWAHGQMVVEITAKDYDMLERTCAAGLYKVHDIFDDISWRRLIDHFGGNDNRAVQKEIKKQFGINVVLPSHSSIITKKKNFYRIEFPASSRPIEFEGMGKTEDVGLVLSGLMIYQYDYYDSTQFEFDQLLRDRDTILKHYVPHEIEGLYMGTQYAKIIYPEGNVAESADGKVKGYDLRGMFMFTGKDIHSTGGAFWEFHFKHPKRKKMMCLSGYLDAPPTTSWTHPIREIQAILRSVTIE